MTTGDEWQRKMVTLIATSIEHYRKQRNLSTQRLADLCMNEAGYPVPRNTIVNLERGRRETVTLLEWLALARALNVAPLLLLFPVGRMEMMEVLPGVELRPEVALAWAERGGSISEGVVTIVSGSPIELFRQHEKMVNDWEHTTQALHAIDSAPYSADAQALVEKELRLDSTSDPELMRQIVSRLTSETRHAQATAIRTIRDRMRDQELTPPPLPIHLAHYLGEEGTRS